jgi:MoaD family protein
VVHYITVLQEITNKESETLEVAPATTVDTVLEILTERYGDRFHRYLFEDDHFRSELHLLVNHKPLRQRRSFDTPLKNNDEINIIPTFFPVSGG